MKLSKTTLVIFCLTAAIQLHAQFQKGDWLLEGGISTHLEGGFGKKNIDLSQGGFSTAYQNNFGWNASAGKFIGPNKEIGLTVDEWWRRSLYEGYNASQSSNPVIIEKYTDYNISAGCYFRRYYDFGKGWYGGFQIRGLGSYTSSVKSIEEDNIEYQANAFSIKSLGLNGKLFVTKMIGKHFGGRISFGDIGWYVEKRSNAEEILYSNFDLNLQNIISPNISIFWTFHGKSKKNRD